jgi:hypothetical protein
MSKNLYKEMMEQAVPSPELIRATKNKMKKESPTMIKHSFRKVAVAMALIAALGATAFAAWFLLTPGEVADQFGRPTLSAAFAGDNAIHINESQTSGGYIFTLMSIVSGDDLAEERFNFSREPVRDRTYAVLAIQKEDGSPMQTFSDIGAMERGDDWFYVSPLIGGFLPTQTPISRAGSMNVIDGVLYALIECDDLSLFADRGLYIGVIPGYMPNPEAFNLSAETGELTPNPDFGSINILFSLPIDPALADPVKAQQYIDGELDEDNLDFAERLDEFRGRREKDGFIIEHEQTFEFDLSDDDMGTHSFSFDGFETRP